MISMTGRLWVCTWRSPIHHCKGLRWTIVEWVTVRWKCCTIGFAVGRPTNRLYSLHWGRWSNNPGEFNAVLYVGLLDYMWFIHCSFFSLQQPWTHQISYQRLLSAIPHSQLLVIWQSLRLSLYIYICVCVFVCTCSVLFLWQCMYICILSFFW